MSWASGKVASVRGMTAANATASRQSAQMVRIAAERNATKKSINADRITNAANVNVRASIDKHIEQHQDYRQFGEGSGTSAKSTPSRFYGFRDV